MRVDDMVVGVEHKSEHLWMNTWMLELHGVTQLQVPFHMLLLLHPEL